MGWTPQQVAEGSAHPLWAAEPAWPGGLLGAVRLSLLHPGPGLGGGAGPGLSLCFPRRG